MYAHLFGVRAVDTVMLAEVVLGIILISFLFFRGGKWVLVASGGNYIPVFITDTCFVISRLVLDPTRLCSSPSEFYNTL